MPFLASKRRDDLMMGSLDGELDSSSSSDRQPPTKDSEQDGKKETYLIKRHYPTHSQYYDLPTEKEQQLRALYKKLDMDGDGVINIKELTAAFLKHAPHVPSKYAKEMVKRADTNASEDIDFREFVHYVLEHEKRLEVVFKDLDQDEDGSVDFKEIKAYFKNLGLSITDQDADRIVKKISVDGTASIDLDEFQKYMLFFPSADPTEIFKFFRHNLVIDIGEDIQVPEDFSESEIRTGVWWRHLVAGGCAGAVSRTCTAPLDRIKVFLQVHANKENGMRARSCFQALLSEGGWKGLWRGNGINVLKIAPESALKFMAYEQMKRLLRRDSSKEVTLVERFLAGSTAGAFSQTVIYPLEVLKTRLALRWTGQLNRGPLDAFWTLWRKEGFWSFYRGYLPNLVGIIPYAGIDLAIYETLKNAYVRRYQSDVKEPGVLALIGCGAISSTCGQLSSYPLALIRTRLQAFGALSEKAAKRQPMTMSGQFQYILNTEGPTGLYRGITPNFMKVLPSVCISYVIYENVRKQLGVKMT